MKHLICVVLCLVGVFAPFPAWSNLEGKDTAFLLAFKRLNEAGVLVWTADLLIEFNRDPRKEPVVYAILAPEHSEFEKTPFVFSRLRGQVILPSVFKFYPPKGTIRNTFRVESFTVHTVSKEVGFQVFTDHPGVLSHVDGIDLFPCNSTGPKKCLDGHCGCFYRVDPMPLLCADGGCD